MTPSPAIKAFLSDVIERIVVDADYTVTPILRVPQPSGVIVKGETEEPRAHDLPMTTSLRSVTPVFA